MSDLTDSDSLRPTIATILRQQGNERGAAIIEGNNHHDRVDTIGFLREELDEANNRADDLEGSADDLADQVRKLTERNKTMRDGVRSIAEKVNKEVKFSTRSDDLIDLLSEIESAARELLD